MYVEIPLDALVATAGDCCLPCREGDQMMQAGRCILSTCFFVHVCKQLKAACGKMSKTTYLCDHKHSTAHTIRNKKQHICYSLLPTCCDTCKCDYTQVIVPGPNGATMQRDFAFHACLGSDTSQGDVMALCGINQLLEAALAGYHVTIFAYGQTGVL